MTQAANVASSIVPSWTTATRPASPTVGQMGYNTTTGEFDSYTSSGWVTVVNSGNGMVELTSGSISSSTATLDIDLSAYSYTCYKVFIRNITMASNTQIWFDKLVSSGTIAGTWYGGATRSGEGAIAQVEYSGQPHWYILGNTTQTTNDSSGQYAGGIDATFMKTGSSNKWMGVANAIIRNGGGGQTQNINTGAFDINTTALWGIRFAGGANIATLSYAVYGVNMP